MKFGKLRYNSTSGGRGCEIIAPFVILAGPVAWECPLSNALRCEHQHLYIL